MQNRLKQYGVPQNQGFWTNTYTVVNRKRKFSIAKEKNYLE